jgi:hypothetical protein
VYFVHITEPGKPPKPIKVDVAQDNDVLFGEISESTVTSLDTIINRVFKPMVDRYDDWGSCEIEQRKEFNSVFDKFASELREALKSMQTNITLEHFNPKWEADARNRSKAPDASMIADFEKIFNEWSD